MVECADPMTTAERGPGVGDGHTRGCNSKVKQMKENKVIKYKSDDNLSLTAVNSWYIV